MNNTYIPNILKDKLSLFFNYFYGLINFSIFIFLIIALFSFDINDDSFLTKSSQPINNLGGVVGSYISSFILYTFGLLGYLFILFFFVTSFLTFIKKRPEHFFIKLFIFFISLILIPQAIIYKNLTINFLYQIENWGVIANKFYLIHQINYVSYVLSFIGVVLFFAALNIHQFLIIPKFKMQNLFKHGKKLPVNSINQKKEPIISGIQVSSIEESRAHENKGVEPATKEESFFSPSLDILENEKKIGRAHV